MDHTYNQCQKILKVLIVLKFYKLSETFHFFEKLLDLVELWMFLYTMWLSEIGPFPAITTVPLWQSEEDAREHVLKCNKGDKKFNLKDERDRLGRECQNL